MTFDIYMHFPTNDQDFDDTILIGSPDLKDLPNLMGFAEYMTSTGNLFDYNGQEVVVLGHKLSLESDEEGSSMALNLFCDFPPDLDDEKAIDVAPNDVEEWLRMIASTTAAKNDN